MNFIQIRLSPEQVANLFVLVENSNLAYDQKRELLCVLDEPAQYIDGGYDGDADYRAYQERQRQRDGDGLDGDFDSGMASAGHGTDEDYGYCGDNEE
jgi:hypothetical protein